MAASRSPPVSTLWALPAASSGKRRAAPWRHGVTEELAIGRYFKRLFVIDTQFGNADYHLERYAAG